MSQGNVPLGSLKERTPVRLTAWHAVAFVLSVLLSSAILYPLFYRHETPGSRASAIVAELEKGRYDEAWTLFETAPDNIRNKAGIQYLAANIEFKRGDLRSARNRLSDVLLALPPRSRRASTVVPIMILRGELCVLLDEEEQIPSVYVPEMEYPVPPEKPVDYLAASYLRVGTLEAYRQAATLAPEYYAEACDENALYPEKIEPSPQRTLLLTQPWSMRPASYRPILNRTVTHPYVNPRLAQQPNEGRAP